MPPSKKSKEVAAAAASAPGVSGKVTKPQGKGGGALQTGGGGVKVKLKSPTAAAATSRPANYAKELEARKKQMEEQLHQVEVQIFKLETQYLENLNPRGNALKGYDGLLTSVAGNDKKSRATREEERIFTNSSVGGMKG